MLTRLLRRSLRPHRGVLSLVVLLQTAQTLANLYLPTLNADIIDNGLVEGDTGDITRTGALMLLVTLAQIGCGLAAAYLNARIAMTLARDLRLGVFRRVQSLSTREVVRFGASSLVVRTTNDVTQVSVLVLMTLTLLLTPITCVGAIVMALNQDVPLSLLLVVIVPVMGIPAAVINARMRQAYGHHQKGLDRINQVLREQIMGVRVIRAFVRDDHERARFADANTDMLRISVRIGRLVALLSALVMLTIDVSVVAAVWIGGHRIDDGSMHIGELTAFLSYLMQILMSVMMVTTLLMMVRRAQVSAGRVLEVLDTRSSVEPPPRPVRSLPEPGCVELTGVEVRLPGADRPVVSEVSLRALPGETTAVIGSTGSGKTTLLHLMVRLLDATAGSVRVGGVDVRELAQDVLADTVGLVPQKAHLFSGTVASNLRYGNQAATDEELWHALEVAQSRDFVEGMPGGLQAPVVQGGANLSGGQRQRLAIARMLVHRPQIYLFDDSFSALDHATDAALRRALADEVGQATVITVAHRVDTFRTADRIVVLDHGRVVGAGTHRELLGANRTYQELVCSQQSGELISDALPDEPGARPATHTRS